MTSLAKYPEENFGIEKEYRKHSSSRGTTHRVAGAILIKLEVYLPAAALGIRLELL